MGAKTALLACASGDVAAALRLPGAVAGAEATGALIARVFPGWAVEQADGNSLAEGIHPWDDRTYAAALPGVDLICDRRLATARGAELVERAVEAAGDRRVVLHTMHSGSSSCSFAVWERGVLIRELGVDLDDGVTEDTGERFAFEAPFWAGEHPIVPVPGWPAPERSALPFDPLELGQAALRALFGFVIEGRRRPGDVDAGAIGLLGYRLVDPSAPDPAVERARLAALVKRMRRRSFTFGRDGSMVEVEVTTPGTGQVEGDAGATGAGGAGEGVGASGAG